MEPKLLPPERADAADPRLPGPLMAALDAWLRLTGPWDRWRLRRAGWTDAGGGNWEPPDTGRRTSFCGTVNPPLEGNELWLHRHRSRRPARAPPSPNCPAPQ